MIKIEYIDLQRIKLQTSEPTPAAAEIEALAQAVLNCDGVLQPVVLRRVGVEQYELIAGLREFLAVQRASELNEEVEMIHAVIAHKATDETHLLAQRALSASVPVSPPAGVNKTTQIMQTFAREMRESSQQAMQTFGREMRESSQQAMQTFAREMREALDKQKQLEEENARLKASLAEKQVQIASPYAQKNKDVLYELCKTRGLHALRKDNKSQLIAKLEADDKNRAP